VLSCENVKLAAAIGDVEIVDKGDLTNFLANEAKVNATLRRQLEAFIPLDSYAVIARHNGAVAGWGFVQRSGKSKYGQYEYSIPEDAHLLKNLYVLPDYRGKSIGKAINLARVSSVPEGTRPIVFVIPDNRVAIRNLEMFGFKKVLLVKDRFILRSVHQREIRMQENSSASQRIRSGFMQ
jgi:GNAT superfamily N-acetyltransferase